MGEIETIGIDQVVLTGDRIRIEEIFRRQHLQVDLGKTLARDFGRRMEAEPAGDGTPNPGARDGSISDLIGYYRRLRDRGDG